MTKLLGAALALTLPLTLGGCSTLSDELFGPGTATPPKTNAATTTATSTPTPRPADQSTPEGAMAGWLAALVDGDGESACKLMATDGSAVAGIKGAAADCAEDLTPRLGALVELKGQFEGLSIQGATVLDDLATFEAATTKPALATQVIHRYKAVRIQDKWYVTE